MIPILDLKAQYADLKGEIDAAVTAVFAAGHFINGPQVAALEREIAEYTGTKHAVALNSGTDALHLALRALDIGPGDEVITTPFSFVATTEAIGIVGATPVFVDIDPATYNIDPALLEAAITPYTKAIIPVHLYGAAAAMDEIEAIAKRHGVAIVEDCAQAIGADCAGRRAGSIGIAGCFSFFPSKNLGAYGDGGMLTTNDEAFALRVRALRAHGGRVKYHHEELGVNSRLDEVQAAILRVKLPNLESWTRARRAIAAKYDAALAAMPGVVAPKHDPHGRHVYHQYTVAVEDRDAVQNALRNAGVQTMVYYPVPLHLQEVHRAQGHLAGDFPHAEHAAARVLSLPIYPELPETDVRTVLDALHEVVAGVAVA
jgi:dTDP-4-amino-4,6-dideoxygalactose transaminase